MNGLKYWNGQLTKDTLDLPVIHYDKGQVGGSVSNIRIYKNEKERTIIVRGTRGIRKREEVYVKFNIDEVHLTSQLIRGSGTGWVVIADNNDSVGIFSPSYNVEKKRIRNFIKIGKPKVIKSNEGFTVKINGIPVTIIQLADTKYDVRMDDDILAGLSEDECNDIIDKVRQLIEDGL